MTTKREDLIHSAGRARSWHDRLVEALTDAATEGWSVAGGEPTLYLVKRAQDPKDYQWKDVELP